MIDYTKFEGHTAGPWGVSDIHRKGFFGNKGEAVIIGPDLRIGSVDCVIDFKAGQGYLAQCPERDANAHLIAAAPDLLAENNRLRDALELIASCDVVIDWDCPNVARRALVGTKP
jgi:hypothetical protein